MVLSARVPYYIGDLKAQIFENYHHRLYLHVNVDMARRATAPPRCG